LADIFISYSSPDRAKARALAEAIQQKGWSVWWDRKIPFGKSFDQVIEQELEAARCVVVVWTNASIASDWVKTEAAEGARRHVLLPVFMDEVKIPLEFRRLQAANLTNWQAGSPNSEFDQLMRHVGEMLGQPTMAEPRKENSFRPQPIRDSAEHLKSEFEQRSPDTSSQEESNDRRTQPAISRTPLLILGGVATLLILIIVVIALRPSGYAPNDRLEREPVSAPAAERQPEPEVASTGKGIAQGALEGIGGSSIPKSLTEPKAKEAEALYSKGEQFYSGSGVQQDYVEAAKWYHKAADLDFAPAQRKLAQMYSEGVGVTKNPNESLKWEIKALSQQQKESSKSLEEMDKKARDAIRHIKPG
jgi:TIR domain/Sel1 repeat